MIHDDIIEAQPGIYGWDHTPIYRSPRMRNNGYHVTTKRDTPAQAARLETQLALVKEIPPCPATTTPPRQ